MDFELAIKLLFIQNTFVVLKSNYLKKQSNLSKVSFDLFLTWPKNLLNYVCSPFTH